ncbi:DUF3343 domain-containing protein [Sporomusa acidovorans]|jgi:Protein of unknown function (DUF3343).|uniref:Putative Se/S carrier protein-like domain-containing protein n=1 Tax=Sporomusa acidovorans (strain ATCC 49682 / DSM 3132 / Mol) TaxID=1123286 RepID=A0ABZ3J1Z6_SPOA4|nr:DUF3343 domain-containing protein [Sporomusa acidovorans]OZC13636.1 hypothetical protein SPACI_56170 [Sporomusa acidovorans DSM 3132]SDE86333.1 Protein of unknown function [Sporomusa acidovorans]
MNCVITFPSVYHAFRAKKLLKEQGINVELVPIPRELSASCEGLAAQVREEDVDRAVEFLGAKGIVMLQKGVKLVQTF